MITPSGIGSVRKGLKTMPYSLKRVLFLLWSKNRTRPSLSVSLRNCVMTRS